MASSIVVMSMDDMGFWADILREDEMERRLKLLIDDWDERPMEDEGEIDRGVEISELDVLLV